MQFNRLASYQTLTDEEIAGNLEKRYTVERLLELCIQSIIDSSRLLVALKGWGSSGNDRDAFLLLAERNVINGALAERLVRAKAFRNILVHEYADVAPELLSAHLRTGFSDLKEFHAAVTEYLRNANLSS